MNGKILLHNGIEKSEVEQDGNFSTIFCSLLIFMETFQLTFVVGGTRGGEKEEVKVV